MKFYPLTLLPAGLNINFVKLSRYFGLLSSCFVCASLVLSLMLGFNLGVDFAGGVRLEVRSAKGLDPVRIRSALHKLGASGVSIQSVGAEGAVAIKAAFPKREIKNGRAYLDSIVEALNTEFSEQRIVYSEQDFISPEVNSYFVKSAIKALVLATLGVALYIWARARLAFAIGAVVTLLHNVLLCLGFMSVSRLDFNQGTIAALLIIIGYCVNDTIVIYERILLNSEQGRSLDEGAINASVNQTLARTLLTSITTLLANLAIIVLGGPALFSFFTLTFVGIAIGTYTSVVLSGPLLLYLARCMARLQKPSGGA